MNDNPIDYLIKQFGISRAQFTKKYALGENHVLLMSQGRKESASPALIKAIRDECDVRGLDYDSLLLANYDTASLNEAYQEWIRQARAVTELKVRIPAKADRSPWQSIVDQIGSVSATSKLLKVRFIAVRKYLTSPVMPDPIREALTDIGWTGITRLERAQERYFAPAQEAKSA